MRGELADRDAGSGQGGRVRAERRSITGDQRRVSPASGRRIVGVADFISAVNAGTHLGEHPACEPLTAHIGTEAHLYLWVAGISPMLAICLSRRVASRC